jgi:voltage-gated potassium channel
VSALHRLAIGILLLAVLLGVGAVGYMLIEGWSFLDALYMTVTVVTTVGFREVQPLSDGGRIFTIFLILFSVGVAFYILIGVVTLVVERRDSVGIGVQKMRNPDTGPS